MRGQLCRVSLGCVATRTLATYLRLDFYAVIVANGFKLETATFLFLLSGHLLAFGYDAHLNRFKVAESFEMRPYIDPDPKLLPFACLLVAWDMVLTRFFPQCFCQIRREVEHQAPSSTSISSS